MPAIEGTVPEISMVHSWSENSIRAKLQRIGCGVLENDSSCECFHGEAK
jgi:hypothetical protein